MKKETIKMPSKERLPTKASTSSVEKWSAERVQVVTREIWVRQKEEQPSNSQLVNGDNR
jgi:hypothetical protein